MYRGSQKILGIGSAIIKNSRRNTVPDTIGVCSTSESPEHCQLSLGGREIIIQLGHT